MSSTARRPLARLGVAAVSVGLVTTVAAPTATAAPSPDALIAEVYGGGGNSGATLTSDFVELANAGAAAVPLDGWSVQYLSSGATGSWQVTPLIGALPAGGRYLVAEAKGAGGTVELPAPDATGAIPLSGTAGIVALVNSTTALTCKTPTDCGADPRVRDLVGYGSAAKVFETAPTANLSNTTSAARAALTDTDDNATDFPTGAPSPTNSKGETPGDGGPPPVVARIHEVQGTTRLSPFDGKRVTGVTGVVTAVRAFGSARGFWFQDTAPDADPATSEGLFAFTGSTTPAVAVGDAVSVTGTVDEYYPDASPTASVQQSTTELTGATWTVASSGNPLPAAEVLGPDTVPTAYAPSPGGSIEPLTLDPAAFALDFWESREGMRVRVDDARFVSPTSDYNEIWVTTKPTQNRSARGGTVYTGYDQPNSGRVQVQSLIPFAQRPFPQGNVGDVLSGTTAGPVDFSSFGGYVIQATELGELESNGLKPEVTRAKRTGELAIATYNVENLSPVDTQAKFDRLASVVVTNLAAPDVLSLEEIQDNTGPADDGVVAADQTLTRFTDAIAAAGGPRYQWRLIDPVDGADGGQPGGNIRVAFLFNPARVSFVDRPSGTATTPVEVVKGRFPLQARLSVSPGRIAPADPAWNSSRKPLVGEFSFRGRPVFVIANHFNSKGGDQPLSGRNQPPVRSSETQRTAQAALVNDFAKKILAVDPLANVVALGDFNDYQFSPALARLTDGRALRTLIDTLPVNERYSYVFEGNSQVLDHILTSPFILKPDYDVVHINAEFADQASDHDPQVVRFHPTSIPWPNG
ncbi:putative large secreted protein [Actinokineospora spheciospongiae]|uniref:Putative large secreted protein n=1 Tax=Actinokineospora spheciospongiae TaxID=909613 RepID=W7J7U0_9PSEU|nr:endonuclease/exonuclease/phosphatase family protein [Actinokineospora spheciospongiae]EWC62104.1 putative large secreted protein [Actinokineospora spheciospongiae]